MSVIDAIIAKKLCGGGGSVPKPLTYDYMPEGYPKKSVGTVIVMEEQELAFALKGNKYNADLTNAFKATEGKTYTINWDGVEYECRGFAFSQNVCLVGNTSIMGAGDNTNEPFVYSYNKNVDRGGFKTLDTSASHTISVKTTEEVITPIAEEFLPNIPADKLPAGGVTTLHINVTAIDEAAWIVTASSADKTPAEMEQASLNGPIWCVLTFAAGTISENAVSVGIPPAYSGVGLAFGMMVASGHGGDGSNSVIYAVTEGDTNNPWSINLLAFGS